jgi:hypothetical protein
MKLALLVLGILLLSTTASAWTLISTETKGLSPVAHGETIAFLTFEDTIDTDLNGDGDLSDYVLQSYGLSTGKAASTGKEAAHLTLFSNLLVFEDKSRMLWQYDIDDKTLKEIKARGADPSIYGKRIAFATSEADAGKDLNDDQDTIDEIIQYYDTGSDLIVNTKAVGNTPVMLDDFLVFATREDDAEQDLNKDNDWDDTLIRALSFDTGQVTVVAEGKNPVGYKHDTVVVTDGKIFAALDLETGEKMTLGISGNNPSLFQDLLAYERDNKLMLYRLSTGVEKPLDIAGKDPELFGDILAFVADDKTITIMKGEDPDKDAVPDFADNCPDASNANQYDKDKDGAGDACDATDDTAPPPAFAPPAPAPAPPVTAQAVAEPAAEPQVPTPLPVERKPLPAMPALEKEQDGKNPTYWFLIAIGLLIIGILLYLVMPRWLQKRRRGFGF